MRHHDHPLLRGFLIMGLVLASLLASPVRAQPAMSATPDLVPGEGSFRLLATGLTNELHRVSLWQGASPVYAWAGSVTPVAGRLDLSLTVPSGFSAGSYTLVVSESRAPTVPVATRPFAVSQTIGITQLSAAVAPGGTVRVRLTDLVPGQLSLTWDGIRAHGPVQNSQASLELEFSSPSSSPTPGQSAFLQSRIEVGRRLVARGGAEIATAAPPVQQALVLRDLQMPSGPRLAGQPFTASGRVESRLPLPPGMRAHLVTELPDGRVLPLSPMSAPLGADGSFSLTAFPRDLISNASALLSGQSGQDRIGFSRGGGGQGGLGVVPAGFGSYGSDEEQMVELRIKVRDPAGQPLAGALVVLDSKLPLVSPPEEAEAPEAKAVLATTSASSAPTQLLAVPSQLIAPAATLLVDDLFKCPLTLSRGYTNAQGIFLARFPLRLLALVNFNIIAIANGPIITYNNTETEIRVLVNAKPALHTFATSGNVSRNHQASLLYRTDGSANSGWSVYNPSTREYDQEMPGANAQIEFVARPLTADVGLDFRLAITDGPRIGTGPDVRLYGPLTTFPPNQYPGIAFQAGSSSSLRIEFDYNEALEGILSRAVLLPAIGNTPIGHFTSADGECATYDKRYVLDIPNVRALQHRDHLYRIRIESGPNLSGQKNFTLRTIAPPPWFADTSLDSRTVDWKPTRVSLSASRSYPERRADGNPPQVGTLRNRSQATDFYSQLIQPSGHEALITTTRSQNQTANQQTPPKSGTSTSPGQTVSFEETLFDSGWIPLFRFVWGVPPIASATFGADARFWAKLFLSTMARLEDGALLTDVTTRPTIGGAINAFFNFSAALGLVDMDASFTPAFALAVTTVVKNANLSAAQSKECFEFTLDVAYDVSVGWCPLCVSFGDEERVIDENSGSGCPVKREILAVFGKQMKAADLGIVQRHPSSLAFDPLGASSLLSLNEQSELEFRPLTSAGLGAPVNLGKARGAGNPQHIYFAPGKAVAVYERSSISSDAAYLASTVEQAAASRNLVWRSLSGNSWTGLFNLTPVNQGDGQVSLAACADGDSGCPAGGEVLAVWVRDPTGQAFGYRFEVWHAFFRNGSWTAPARVDDPGNGSDMHPRATYLNGMPLVSWVRTPTRSIAAAPQRRLMVRALNGQFPAAEITGAPQGVLWQDLTSDGNGRAALAFTANPEAEAFFGNQAELWFAEGQCTATSCSWSVSQQRDAYGRALRGESPSLTRAGDGSVRVAFRSLGHSPNAQGERVFPGDSLGQVTGSGDLLALQPRLGNQPVLPQLLSSDGLVHFAPVLRHNPISGELLSLSAIANQALANEADVSEALGMALGKSQAKQVQVAGGLALTRIPDLPDFVLEEAVHVGGEFAPGGVVEIKLLLRNAGPRWQSDTGLGMLIYASWDRSPEYLRERAVGQVLGFPSDGLLDVTVSVPVPADFPADMARTLYVNINGDFLFPEVGLENNLVSLLIGELPAPSELVPLARSEDRYLFFSWQPVEDDRVKGYTVYRSEPEIGEPWIAVGSSFEPAFVDLTAFPGRTYSYRVVSYSANGFESAPSNEVVVEAAAVTRIDLFQSGFDEGEPEEELVLPGLP